MKKENKNLRKILLILIILAGMTTVLIVYKQMCEVEAEKVCRKNLKDIQSAVKLYLMEHQFKLKWNEDLSFKHLLDFGCIKTIPVCPDGGKYKFFISKKEGTHVRCSKHSAYNTQMDY